MRRKRTEVLVLDSVTYQFIEGYSGHLLTKDAYEALCSKWKELSIVKKHAVISYKNEWKNIWMSFYKLDQLYNSFYCFNLKNKDPEQYEKLQDEDFKRTTLSYILGDDDVKIVNENYRALL